jgi:CUB/sushi domain-containing protein
VGQSAVATTNADYSYDDDYEETPDTSQSLSPVALATTTSTTEKSSFGVKKQFNDDDENEERRKNENNVIKAQLDTMSDSFKRTINKLKIKHKRIEIVFLVDSSSSVGKDNFLSEIGFVKRLLSDFNVSFNYTRVALITFSSRSKIVRKIQLINYTFLIFLFSMFISTKFRRCRKTTTNAFFLITKFRI